MFKSAEEREAERREREAEEGHRRALLEEQRRAAELERQRAQFDASPAGAATAAKQAGERFLELQLEVGGHAGSAMWGATEGRRTAHSSAGILAEVERLGWRLEHANYFFMITGETSSQRVFLTGEATAVNGVTVGAYLFRNTDVVD